MRRKLSGPKELIIFHGTSAAENLLLLMETKRYIKDVNNSEIYYKDAMSLDNCG
jgi:hypothetical protein